MIAVNPMPNELAMAHEGRIGWINGCTSQLEVDALVALKPAHQQAGFFFQCLALQWPQQPTKDSFFVRWRDRETKVGPVNRPVQYIASAAPE